MKDHKLLKGLIHFTRNLHLSERSSILYLIRYVIYVWKYYFLNFNIMFFMKYYSFTYTPFHSLYVLEILSISINCHHFFRVHWSFSMSAFYFFAIIHFSDIDMHDISGYTVGTPYLNNLQISLAEMTQYLCNMKMSRTNCITKKYRVPFFNYALTDKIVMKCMNRPVTFKSLTLTEYSRELNKYFLAMFFINSIVARI